MNATELNAMLCDQAESVVLHLFPGAKRKGPEMVIGDITGAAGDSLSIRVSGSKVGNWSDFAGTVKGKQLIGLWHQARNNASFAKTMDEVRDYLGVAKTDSSAFYNGTRPTKKACPPIASRPISDAAEANLIERGISKETWEKYGVGWGDVYFSETESKLDALIFPYKSTNGSLEMGKFIALKRKENGKKIVQASGGTSKVLFGKNAVKPDGGELVICEGEIDALSLSEMGYPAVSVPFGAKCEGADGKDPNDEWIENDFDYLECFSRIYLCLDDDEAGKAATQSIAKRLGYTRCYVIKMPTGCKDANEVLVKGLQADLHDCVENAKTIDPAELRHASDFREDVWNKFNPRTEQERGIPFFLDNLKWRMRRGELTLWTGFSGSGKSEILNHLQVYLRSVEERCCLASFEMPAETTLRNMTQQAAGIGHFGQGSRADFDHVYSWLTELIWVVDRVGNFSYKELLKVLGYAVSRYRIGHVIIDSLLCCDIAEDDYNAQKAFVNAFRMFCKEYQVHGHLVAHPRKRDDESKAPSKLDVRGGGALTDLPQNGITVFRNKAKEDAIKKLSLEGKPKSADLERQPDGFIEMWKQRENGELPTAPFYFLAGVRQYTDKHTTPAKRYAPALTQ